MCLVLNRPRLRFFLLSEILGRVWLPVLILYLLGRWVVLGRIKRFYFWNHYFSKPHSKQIVHFSVAWTILRPVALVCGMWESGPLLLMELRLCLCSAAAASAGWCPMSGDKPRAIHLSSIHFDSDLSVPRSYSVTSHFWVLKDPNTK